MNQIDPARAAAQRAAMAEQMAARTAVQTYEREHGKHGHPPRDKAGLTSTFIVIGIVALAIASFVAMVMRS